MGLKGRKIWRALRWPLIGALALLALAIAIVELMSWNFLKPMIADRIESATGRSAAIEGDVAASLFPRPHLTVKGLVVENPDWAEAPNMIEVERVTAALSVSDLLTGQIALAELAIHEPLVNLERQADGSANWAFRPTESSKQDSGSGSPISIQRLDVSDARVRYWGPQVEAPLSLAIPSLEASDDGESLAAEASMRIRDKELRFQASADSLDAFWSEESAFGGKATLTSSESSLELAFSLPRPSLEGVEAEWDLAVENLASWAEIAGVSNVEWQTLDFAGGVTRDGSEWRFGELQLGIADSSVTGELVVDTGSEPLRVEGWLHADAFDAAAFRGKAQPRDEQPSEGVEIPVFPEIQGQVDLSADRVALAPGTLESLEAQLVLAPHQASLENVSFDIGNGTVAGAASLTSSPEFVTGEARLTVNGVDMSALDLGQGMGGVVNAELEVELARVEQQPTLPEKTLLAHLGIEQAELSYEEPGAGTSLQADLTLSGEPAVPRLTVDGQFREQPVAIEVTGDPLSDLDDPQGEYAIDARASSGGLQARLDASLASLQSPNLGAGLEVWGEGGEDLEAWIGRSLPQLPGFRFDARLSRDGALWSATDLEAKVGESSLTGRVQFRAGAEPRLEADLTADRIDLATLLPQEGDQSSGPEQGEASNGNAAPDLSPLREIDAQIDFQANTLALPNGSELKDVELAASVQDGQARLELEPLQVAGGSASAEATLDASVSPASGRLMLAVDEVDLSEALTTPAALEEKLGVLSGSVQLGVTQWRAEALDQGALLPYVGRVRIDESELRFRNPDAETDLTLQFQTAGLAEGEQAFRLSGNGQYAGAPFSLAFQGDPLLAARDPDRPYALQMNVQLADSEAEVRGTLQKPFALEGLDLNLDLTGSDPQRLSELLGVPLPDASSFSVAGDVLLEDGRWALKSFEAQVGESDLKGSLAYDSTQPTPRLVGELRSQSLDFEDLGLARAEGEGSADPPQEGGDPESPDRRILPDAPLFANDAVQELSADVQYHGESVVLGGVPMEDFKIDLSVEEGRLTVEPVSFDVGAGSVDMSLALNLGVAPPKGTLRVEVQGVDLRAALSEWEVANDSFGTVAGRGKFWVQGATIAELLASADGGLVLLMTGGRLDALLVELAGLDAGESFVTWMQDSEQVRVYCAYADVQMRDGVARLDTFVVDTSDTTFAAGGTVDFNDETLDITLAAHPKDASVLVARTPLHLGGTFANVEPGVHSGQLAARVTGSAALAAVAGPVAALLPLLDLGTADDTGLCDGLVNRTQQAMQDVEVPK